MMDKKVCLITGATSGIGKATASALAAKGMLVVLVARTYQSGLLARLEIQAEVPGASLAILVADLSSQDAIRSLAVEFGKKYGRLDVLINNAGVFVSELKYTMDGIEVQFAVNHLSYFLLTNLLLPVLSATPHPRVINVSSRGHRLAKLDFNDLFGAGRYDGVRAYALSKLCNVLFTYELARRLSSSSVTVNCLHPGSIKTEIGSRHSSGLYHWLWRLNPLLQSVAAGAATSVYLATSPDVTATSGKYFYRCKPVESSSQSRDADLAARLWSVSEKMTRGSQRESNLTLNEWLKDEQASRTSFSNS